MMNKKLMETAPLVTMIAAASPAWAQVQTEDMSAPQQQIEEVMVQGRLRDSAEMLISERLEEEVVTDILGSEMIGRVGDSTVAAALRRVSGLSLVSDKFVYVRGLGERYSSTTLNGAAVPSPDLTRSVIPLDIFPTSIVDSLAVQKSYSADQPASFGGGNVDVRTKGIPDQLTYSIELGSGFNTETPGNVLSYKGGSDDSLGTDDGTRALPSELSAALQRFLGNLGIQAIRNTLVEEGQFNSPVEANETAQQINRDLATSLNRDIAIEEEPSDPDADIKASVGNRFYLSDNWELGFLASVSYQKQWRENDHTSRSFGDPEEVGKTEKRSTHSVDLTGSLNLGLRFADEHSLSTTSLYLRNTDDETSIADFFSAERKRSSGRGFREYNLKYEERDLRVNQIVGSHSLGAETKALLPLSFLDWVPEDLVLNWHYSDSRATTDIPNEVSINADTVTDSAGEVTSSRLAFGSNGSSFRFTDLQDDVTNFGWGVALPLQFSNSSLELGGGFERSEKARRYRETRFLLGTVGGADSSALQGSLDQVLGDENITNPDNNFLLGLGSNNDNQSYIAAVVTDAAYGKLDWTLNQTWRFSAGARWEDYNQVALNWNPQGFSIDNPQLPMDPEILAEGTFSEDRIYPSLSVIYMGSLWAETFQLRFGASKTAVRPDLREITDAIYFDPITDLPVKGNSGVVPSEITNFDIRAEWFFDNGDNLTVSTYYKGIEDPIEFFELASTDVDTVREILNADSGEIYGVEFEGLKTLGFLGDTMDSFFVQGNLTVQDSELVAGERADAPTNPEREMSEASEYVVNMLVGFDSPDGNHSATLAYNVFGERLYLAGRNGAPDQFEQPFNSLDLTYFWYPTPEITVKAKLQNLLDSEIEIEIEGVTVFEEKPGQTFALSAQYKF